MTKQWSFFLLLFCSTILVQAQTQPGLEKYLSKFEKAVITHNYKALLKLSDADYKAEQHDAFLSGNTRQFIDELLSGYQLQTNAFINFRLSDIDAISIKEIVGVSEEEYTVHWLIISNQSGTATCSLTIAKKGKKWGYVGAVG